MEKKEKPSAMVKSSANQKIFPKIRAVFDICSAKVYYRRRKFLGGRIYADA